METNNKRNNQSPEAAKLQARLATAGHYVEGMVVASDRQQRSFIDNGVQKTYETITYDISLGNKNVKVGFRSDRHNDPEWMWGEFVKINVQWCNTEKGLTKIQGDPIPLSS
jgi:hypothetical protein